MEAVTVPTFNGAINLRDLERRVVNFLYSRQVPALRRIEVEASDGRVTLHGTVKTFYHKQLCLSCCRRVAGVLEVIDDIRVDDAHAMATAE